MVTTKLMTAADLAALPEGDGFRYELIEGVLHKEMAPAGGPHGSVAARMTHPLHLMMAAHPAIGEIFIAEEGFFLRHDPDTVVAPDASFVLAEALPPGWNVVGSGYLPCVPTLVIEVVSPSNSLPEVMAKVDVYLKAGVPLIWVAFPATRTVLVDGAGRERLTLTAADALDGGDVLPHLPPLRVADLFR